MLWPEMAEIHETLYSQEAPVLPYHACHHFQGNMGHVVAFASKSGNQVVGEAYQSVKPARSSAILMTGPYPAQLAPLNSPSLAVSGGSAAF